MNHSQKRKRTIQVEDEDDNDILDLQKSITYDTNNETSHDDNASIDSNDAAPIDDDSKPTVEFVILFGPPCSGKTFYCETKLQNHIRVCPSEIFYEHPALSLHKIINTVVSILRKGDNVVLDDTNQSSLERTRRAYISAIQKQMGNSCVINVIKFLPSGGKLQCLWANEFAFAERCVPTDQDGKTLAPFTYLNTEANMIGDWYQHASVPQRSEGYNHIKEVISPLKAKSPRKTEYKTPGLLIDFRCLFQLTQNEKFEWIPLQNPVKVINEWISQHHSGRIIVLIDESAVFPTTVELLRIDPIQQKKRIDQLRNEVRKMIRQNLTFSSNFPVYYVACVYDTLDSSDFYRLPLSGMIAFSQYRHHLSLDLSLLVIPSVTMHSSNSQDNVNANGRCINVMSCIEGEKMFKDSGWSLTSKINKYSTTPKNKPSFLTKMEMYYTDDTSDTSLTFPLSNQFDESARNSVIEEKAGNVRVHGAIFQDKPHKILRSPQKSNNNNAVVMTMDSDMMTSPSHKRKLPNWMSGGGDLVSPVKKRSPPVKKVVDEDSQEIPKKTPKTKATSTPSKTTSTTTSYKLKQPKNEAIEIEDDPLPPLIQVKKEYNVHPYFVDDVANDEMWLDNEESSLNDLVEVKREKNAMSKVSPAPVSIVPSFLSGSGSTQDSMSDANEENDEEELLLGSSNKNTSTTSDSITSLLSKHLGSDRASLFENAFLTPSRANKSPNNVNNNNNAGLASSSPSPATSPNNLAVQKSPTDVSPSGKSPQKVSLRDLLG